MSRGGFYIGGAAVFMQTIEIHGETTATGAGPSSKGNQLKWEQDGWWYKADAFFLNEDRHTNNIALLYDTETKEYRLCPFFDMGLSLFSDTREAYPLEEDAWTCRAKIHAKPFERDFDEQLDAAELLCGDHLRFTLPAGRIADVVGEPEGYEKEELARVREVLHVQAGKYRNFFAE